MVLKSAESLPFTQFIFVHVDNKIIANVTESTLLVFFQVQAVPQLVLTSSYRVVLQKFHENGQIRPEIALFDSKMTNLALK